ncbi:MAG TPA: arsenic resistance N-acetyltransferase ArsN2 [Burkholderiaceae bacterium]|nr:arsenic resistance N-acetyltransferase ArsN2 [Burkholderiaceae bacterium]
MTIKPLAPDAKLKQILRSCDLPVEDIDDTQSGRFFGYFADDNLAGVVGLELYPPAALLRSLAVLPPYRGDGVGRALLRFAERQAAMQDVSSLFLLTNSAAAFFAKQGYAMVARSEAPAAIRATTQFASLCPASAVFMAKYL